MVGRLLGHSQIQTTMRYARLADDPVKRAAEVNANRLSALVSSGPQKITPLRVIK